MDAEDLLAKAKSGDKQALSAWAGIYRTDIARLAYQAGMPKDEIGKFYLELIKAININGEESDNGSTHNRLLEAAVRKLLEKEGGLDNNHPKEELKFEEDLQVHQALQDLPLLDRISLILVKFHGKSIKETAALTKQTDEQTESAFEQGLVTISRELAIESGGHVHKRLDLLMKSYDRLEFPDDELLIEEMHSMKVVGPFLKKPAELQGKRRTVALLAGAGLFLAAVIGISFLFNEQPGTPLQTAAEEENPTTVTKQMVKKWEAEYEEIRNSAPEKLAISPETFEQLGYVRKADELKERTFSRHNVNQLKDDPERMIEQVETLMLHIETPKGMIDAIADHSLHLSEASKFLWIYTEKTDQLMAIADGMLAQYQEELSDAKVNGELSAEKLTYSRGEYPEEIEELTAALREYTFNYMVHPNEERFKMIRDINKIQEMHPFNSDTLSIYYLDILRNAPYTDETGLLWPVEHMPHSLWTMTAFLSEPNVDPGLKAKVEPVLSHTFHTMIKGAPNAEVFDSNGVVKEEFQFAWKNMMQISSNPITFLMLPILEEFEASGWKESVHYDRLAHQDIAYTIELERKGELAEKLPNGDLEIQSAFLDLKEYDYSDIKPLYAAFSASHDLKMLSGVEPIEIIKLYYYANNIEDTETMWHLTADDRFKPSLEDYQKTWKKRPELTEFMRDVDIYKENIHRQGRQIFLIATGTPLEDEQYYHNMHEMVLITERDQVWLMQNQLSEVYTKEQNFEEYDKTVQSLYQNLVQSGDIKTLRYFSAAEVGGVSLLAKENEDLKTLRMLVNLADESIDDDEFELRWMSMPLPAYSKMWGISFRSNNYSFDVGDETLRGDLNVMNDAINMEDSQYFPMEQVDNIWLIGDMYGY